MTGVILSAKSTQEIEDHIAGILADRGESFLDDDGVDKDVCQNVAKEITAYLKHVIHDLELSIIETRLQK